MNDDVERRLRRDLPAAGLPPAPDSLRTRLRDIAAREPTIAEARPTFSRSRMVLGLAAVTLAAGALLYSGGAVPHPSNIPPSVQPSTSTQVTPTNPPATQRPLATMVDGLPVMTVSEAQEAHAAGHLAGGRAAIGGWWSNGSVVHSCAPPLEPTGDLELYCHDGEYGIAERNELMFVVELPSGVVTYQAQGPHLSPYYTGQEPGIELFVPLQPINGQPFPPVPIIVLGHFDDPRAADCRPAARQLCLDRFVLERIVEFRPESVPTPGVTPPPTPFPDPAPSGLFPASRCFGDGPYSFVGWTTTADLGIPFDRPGHIFAMVTADVIMLTEDGWQVDNGSGHQYQIWGRRVCLAPEWSGYDGIVEFSEVPGSTYVLWDDGLKVPGIDPQRP